VETNRRWDTEHLRWVTLSCSWLGAFYQVRVFRWHCISMAFWYSLYCTRSSSYSRRHFCPQASGLGSGVGRGHLCHLPISSICEIDMDSCPRYFGYRVCGVIQERVLKLHP